MVLAAVVVFALPAAVLLGSGLGAGSRTGRTQQLDGVGDGAGLAYLHARGIILPRAWR